MRQPQQGLSHLVAASHDLRGPLQVIASYVELLAEGFCGPLNADQHSYLTRVRGQVDHLAHVIDSILLLARAERDRALELSDVPVLDVLAEVCALLEPLAAAGGVSLTIDFDGAPSAVRTERAALRRVLANLVGNAIKFTPRGGQVSVSAVAVPGAVELRVSDTGPGISKNQLETIFQPFVRLPSVDVPPCPGIGLGLTIARDLARLLGGDIVVRSVVGVGSLFVVRLPAAYQSFQPTVSVAAAIAA